MQVVSDQVIPRRARDLAPQILEARRAGADRLVVWASAADVAATLEAVHQAGWDVPVHLRARPARTRWSASASSRTPSS